MKFLFAISICIFTLAGCAYSISDINTANSDPVCVRECAATYSSCVSAGNQIGLKTETLRACKEAYGVCISTCPPK